MRVLRQAQFPEDAGPMAHPVRPDSYVEINNFYTVTIYEKGAEVVRMLQTLVGRDGFRKGMDLYFARHDGQAVTCDDFRAAMADANARDLSQFERWYSQAGTPRVSVRAQYDAAAATYTLEFEQSCAPSAGQPEKLPLHIPIAVGLLDGQGHDLPLRLEDTKLSFAPTTIVLELTKAKQSFTFKGINSKPVPSLLRDFSAPVTLDFDYSDDELAFLLAHDSDAFNRWEAGQRLATRRLLALAADAAILDADYQTTRQDTLLFSALGKLLNDKTLDPAFRELVLSLPSEGMLAEQMAVIDPQAIHLARRVLRRQLAVALRADLLAAYQDNHTPGAYRPDAKSAGKRALRNCALSYLAELEEGQSEKIMQDQLEHATNMTDRIAALAAMVNHDVPAAKQALKNFYTDFSDEPLVIDKWFSLQGAAPSTDVAAVRKLMKHPAFNLKNPNRARSLIFAFCNANPARFHAADGSGHLFWAEQVIALNAINPQVAARLARSVDRWRKFTPALQASMRAALQKVAATKKLSKDVAEVIDKSLTN